MVKWHQCPFADEQCKHVETHLFVQKTEGLMKHRWKHMPFMLKPSLLAEIGTQTHLLQDKQERQLC